MQHTGSSEATKLKVPSILSEFKYNTAEDIQLFLETNTNIEYYLNASLGTFLVFITIIMIDTTTQFI